MAIRVDNEDLQLRCCRCQTIALEHMTAEDSRLALLQRLALWSALLVLMIVGISAFIRLSGVGLGCSPWPQCYGQISHAEQRGVLQTADAEVKQSITLVRLAHRVFAVLLLPLILVLVIAGFTMKPRPWGERWMALLALCLVLFLAVLGRWTAGVRVPAVALGNLLGGFLLFGLCWRMAVVGRVGANSPSLSHPARLARYIAVAILLLQIGLGGLVSSGLAGLSCPDLSSCTVAKPVPWDTLNLLREPNFDASLAPVNADGALAHALHRWVAALAVLAVSAMAIALLRQGRRREGLTLLFLLLAQMALGLGLVAAGLPLAIAVAHNIVAALLLANLLSVD